MAASFGGTAAGPEVEPLGGDVVGDAGRAGPSKNTHTHLTHLGTPNSPLGGPHYSLNYNRLYPCMASSRVVNSYPAVSLVYSDALIRELKGPGKRALGEGLWRIDSSQFLSLPPPLKEQLSVT